MGDLEKPRFSKRGKERGATSDEFEFSRSPVHHESLIPGDYGKGYDATGVHKRKGPHSPGLYGSSPRTGNRNYLNSPSAFKNSGLSPGGRLNDSYKDQIKKYISDDHHSNSENWRNHKSPTKNHVFNRSRKDSSQELEEGNRHWQQEGKEKGGRNVRRQLQKDPTQTERYGECQAASPTGCKRQQKVKKSKRNRRTEYDEDDLDAPVIDESMLSEKELLGLHQAEERLRRDFIYRLRRRPRSFPTAKYTCRLCDVLIESVAFAHKHIKEKRHKKNIKEKQEEELLTTLSPPGPHQVQAISAAIEKVLQENGLGDDDIERRHEVSKTMEKVIHCRIPDCSLRLYGSSCTGFGFKNSDINIDIQFPPSMNQPDVLLLVQESLINSVPQESFIDVEADFHVRVPVVVCRDKQSGLLCKVSAGNESACLTTSHFAVLAKLEPSLVPLVVAFRQWAKICHIDHPEEGGLPPYVFALMIIYFLQQRKEPILPVYFGLWIEGFSINKLVNFSLKAVEDEKVTWEYNPALEDASHPYDSSFKTGKAPLIFALHHQCAVPLGQLWVELFRFYALEFNMADYVISIRLKEPVSRELKDWPKKRIAVEDPYSVKRNVARTLNSQLVYEYILHCLKTTYKYFALPHKRTGKSNKRNQHKLEAKTTHKNKSPPEDVNGKEIKGKLETIAIDCSNLLSTMDGRDVKSLNAQKLPDGYGSESLTEEDGAESLNNGGVTQDESDCVIEEVVLEESENFRPSCDDTESGNELEEQHKQGGLCQKHLTVAEQVLDEDSENGEFSNFICTKGLENEIESLSDSEGFIHPGAVEIDDFGLDDAGALEDKEDDDGDSSDDELEELPNKFMPLGQGHKSVTNNTDEDEEEDSDFIINQRVHLDSITREEEMENMFPGSEEEEEEGGHSDDEQESLTCDSDKEEATDQKDLLHQRKGDVRIVCEDDALQEKCEETDYFYEFRKFAFTKGKLATVVCSFCKREGHLKKDCPEDFKKIELDSLPPMMPKFLAMLDQVCIQCYKDFSPDTIENHAREHIRHNLESFIRQEFEGARLSLFGSSKNGFGFKQSDLDICMTFDGIDTAEGLDCIKIIEDLARVLRKHSGLKNILPITTAKVPIVKFFHVRSSLEGDISLYNTLALHNTRLLASYAAIDFRVQYLCYTMKVFAKMCDIGDASRGSLSSYAYTLMVLYFLQQTNPPVIPVLQEIYDGPRKPEILVDGWNVYFFNKIEELPDKWSEYGKNTESVGALWLGLLRFYTEEFDFKEHVICIRRKSLLTTFKKQWTSKYIVIEGKKTLDPFDLNHNLGAGLSRKMTNFIMKAFINGRRVFGTPIKSFPKEYPTKMEYFFDPAVLTEGELAPNDRCCRICGKIGHFMKDCPLKRKLKRRRDQDDLNHQRYLENKQRRDKDDMETTRDGKPQLTHQKGRPEKAVHEAGRDRNGRQSSEKWRRQDEREFREKRCFVCGMEGHIKKDCPHYKGVPGSFKAENLMSLCGSPSAPSILKQADRANQGTPSHEEKRKQNTKGFLSPQSGSLTVKHATQGRSPQKMSHPE
uniref:RNA uridylyltransferase n=1 Tax=Latimeria chalumnae TaxID=7897 RepID=H2ZWR3_LATCH